MKRLSSIAALAAVLALATGVAVAQNGNGNGGNSGKTPSGSDDTPAAQCEGTDRESGGFGACVSAKASEFGRAMAAEAQERAEGENGENGVSSQQNGENGENGERQDSRNPTQGVTVSPTEDGREFGRQVSENAQQLGNGNGNGNGNRQDAGRNPTQGVEPRPPEANGRDYGEIVSGNAQGNRPESAGPPEGAGRP